VAQFEKALRSIWEYVREVFGENAYPRYCDYVLSHGGEPMTPRQFYLWHEERKHSCPNRCC
jgi:hypothetical protein